MKNDLLLERIKDVKILDFDSIRRKLTKREGNTFVCPFCGSGNGNNGTAAFTYYPDSNNFYCYSSACPSKDLPGNGAVDALGLYMQLYGVSFPDAKKALAEEKNLSAEDYRPTRSDAPKATKKPRSNQDFTAYIQECSLRLAESQEAQDYLKGRGISIISAQRFKIGFDDKARRMILPSLSASGGCTYYTARAIDSASASRYGKYLNLKGTRAELWNKPALYAQEVNEVFITEGAFDALSIVEAGGQAVALNSAGNYGLLLDAVREKKPACLLILALDNDGPGEKAGKDLANGLLSAGIPFSCADVAELFCGCKDANDALITAPDQFRAAVRETIRKAHEEPDGLAIALEQMAQDAQAKPEVEEVKQAGAAEDAPPEKALHLESTNEYLEKFFQTERAKAREAGQISTGFSFLDKKTGGGLNAGLYIFAAGTSLGKTTFCLQLADNMAAAGQDVLYITMEQSRLELICKSLARTAYNASAETSLTADRIRNKALLPREEAELQQAVAIYKDRVKGRVSILEGNFGFSIQNIAEAVKGYVDRTGKRPVVIVDYLQILRPSEKHQNAKETVDCAITEMKTLSRDYGLCVIAISSVNRANYLYAMDLDSLKESGGIEYTADAVFFLQLLVMKEKLFDSEKNVNGKREKVKQAKAANPREVNLICLKNRFGIANFECDFNYFPGNDYFEETVHLRKREETF